MQFFDPFKNKDIFIKSSIMQTLSIEKIEKSAHSEEEHL